MNLPLPAPRRSWPRRLVTTLVALVVLAVAAGTFVLSYAGVHAIALQAGVSARLAQVYPGLFDAVLVIACVAAVALRDARWWARVWAWAVLIVVLSAIGAADAAHAMDYSLPHRLTEGLVAAAPAAAVLVSFSLLLTLLRYAHAQAPGAANADVADRSGTERDVADRSGTERQATDAPAVPGATSVSGAAGTTPRQPAPPIALPPAAAGEAVTGATSHTGDTAGAAAMDKPVGQDYWDADDDHQLAGQVYPVLVAEPDDDQPSPDVDQDAPPFATAPFAAVPRLNRSRVTPTPPSESE